MAIAVRNGRRSSLGEEESDWLDADGVDEELVARNEVGVGWVVRIGDFGPKLLAGKLKTWEVFE